MFAVVFRTPFPYLSFARFPPFPLLGGVIAEPGIHLVGIFGVFTPGIFLGHPLQTNARKTPIFSFLALSERVGEAKQPKRWIFDKFSNWKFISTVRNAFLPGPQILFRWVWNDLLSFLAFEFIE
jgi:hypothetical protein